jgi:DNA/RNA endonuclease YhcR with UshA esterase domain
VLLDTSRLQGRAAKLRGASLLDGVALFCYVFTHTNKGGAAVKAILMLLVMALPVVAHHSVQAEFDLDKPITISGKVTKVEWINPHSYLYMDVNDDKGNVKHWSFEMAGPGALRRTGLSRSDRGGLKAGDMITVNGILAKDGSDFGLVKNVKLPDGRVFTIWTDDPNAK